MKDKIILVDAVDCFIIKEDEKFVIFPEMFDLLEKYDNKKIILTGASDDKYELYGLDKVPYEFFTLKHNPEKTDPEYYKKMLEKFNLNESEVVYFEHNKDAVKSAQSVGIKTYFYDNNVKDLVSLKNFLDSSLN